MIEILEYLTQGVAEAGSSGTLRIDLPENEQITQMMLELKITNSSTILNTRTPLDVVTSVEIVAGGKTIFSLEPEAASAACFYLQNGKVPRHIFRHGKTMKPSLRLPLFFGRFQGDSQYLLDTSRYKNPQLVIAWSMDTTYEDSASFTHTISYSRPLEKLADVQGFIRWREIKKSTSSGSAETIRHSLPVDFPWLYLACRVEDINANIRTNLTDVLLNIDSGRLRLIDVAIDELWERDGVRFPNPNAYYQQFAVAGNATCKTHGDGDAPMGNIIEWLAHRSPAFTSITGEQMLITIYGDAAGEASDDVGVSPNVPTAHPHGSLTLFDGRDHPFPITDYGQAWVDYKVSANVAILYTYVAEVVLGSL